MKNSSPEYARVNLGRICITALSRHGGVSGGDYVSLNLGSHVGDTQSDVDANWKIVKELVDSDGITYLHADHGTTVNVAGEFGEAPTGDGLVCKTPKHAIAALSADCVPVALVDPVNNVIAVGHAGWKGVLAHLMTELAKSFVELGADISKSTAVIGPSICGDCYEVGADRVELFGNSASVRDSTHLDLAAGVREQLSDLGFEITQIPGCNFEDENLFSYRRSGSKPTGRGGLVAIIN